MVEIKNLPSDVYLDGWRSVIGWLWDDPTASDIAEIWTLVERDISLTPQVSWARLQDLRNLQEKQRKKYELERKRTLLDLEKLEDSNDLDTLGKLRQLQMNTLGAMKAIKEGRPFDQYFPSTTIPTRPLRPEDQADLDKLAAQQKAQLNAMRRKHGLPEEL